MSFSIKVYPIISQLLGDDLKLFHPISHQVTNLLQNFFFRSADMLAGNDWDGTIGAVAVTALRYLDVGIMSGRCEMSLTVASLDFSLSQIRQQLLVIELAIEFVHLWNFFFKLILIAFTETTHDKEFV